MENILLKDLIFVKIADFGTGTDLERSATSKDIGTACNNPPGVLPGYMATKFDVFQCGAVLLQMLCVDILQKKHLFGPKGGKLWEAPLFAPPLSPPSSQLLTFTQQCNSSRDTLHDGSVKCTNVTFWNFLKADFLTDEIRDLLNGMLDADETSRFSLEQVLAHPWMMSCADDITEAEAVDEMQKKLGSREI